MDLLLELENSKKSTLRNGRVTTLLHIKDRLLAWLANMREEGIPVSINMLVIQATILDEEFGRKNFMATYQAVRRMLKANGWSIRAKTHEA